MAVPFSNTKLRVPKGFQNILEGLAREVLRSQPEDIFEFGAKYLDQLMKVREETGHDPAVHGARLEDRFYNNDSFKSPSVDPGSREQQDAAVKIQSNYRKHAAEQEVEVMREEDAAEKIQAGFRGYQDRQRFSDMKKASSESSKSRDPEKAKEEEEVDIDLDDPEVEQAAMKIQAGFKGFKARQEVKELKEQQQAGRESPPADKQEEEVDIDLNDPEVNDAALKIQAGFRGHQTRKQIKDMQGKTEERENHPDIDINDPELADAALKIQTGFRGHLARKEIQSMKEEKNKKSTSNEAELDIDINDPELGEAAQKIQAGFRGHKARKEVDALKESRKSEEAIKEAETQEEEEVDIDLTDPEVENAALKIQAGFKGMKARQEVKSLKESKETEKSDVSKEEAVDIDLDDPETEAAALKIQAGFKGYKTRKELKDKISTQSDETSKDPENVDVDEEEAVDIDLNDPEVEKAATKIQAGYKGFKTRKDLKESKTGPEPDAAGKTEESEKEGEDAKKEGALIDVSPESAQKIINVLSAFHTYKKTDTLPDRLRLTKGHIESVQKWRKMAKRKLKKRTFSSMTQLMGYLPFGAAELSDLDDEEEDVKGQGQAAKPIVTSQKDPQKFDIDFDFFGDMENESDDDWNLASDVVSDDVDDDDDELGKHFSHAKQHFDLKAEAQPFMKHIADDMGDVMGNMVSTMMPLQEKVVTKSMMYKPYKAGLETFETWMTEKRPSLNSREVAKYQQQLELYRTLVAHMDQMAESDPEDKVKQDKAKLMTLQNRLTKLGDVPDLVQAKQDGVAAAMMTEQPEIMGDVMTQMIGGMEEAMAGLFSGLGGMAEGAFGPGGTSPRQGQSGSEEGCTIL